MNNPAHNPRYVAFLFLTAIMTLPVFSFSQSRDVPFTLEDRDRSIRMEEKISSLEKSMNVKFESQQQQINDIKTGLSAVKQEIKDVKQEIKDVKQEIKDVKQEIVNLFYWGFGILFTMMLFIFGFIVWDRRTLTEPIREKMQSLVQSLREYAKEQPKLADILRLHGLM